MSEHGDPFMELRSAMVRASHAAWAVYDAQMQAARTDFEARLCGPDVMTQPVIEIRRAWSDAMCAAWDAAGGVVLTDALKEVTSETV